jgi:hypothetical protein
MLAAPAKSPTPEAGQSGREDQVERRDPAAPFREPSLLTLPGCCFASLCTTPWACSGIQRLGSQPQVDLLAANRLSLDAMCQSIVVPASLILASLFALAANAGVPLTPLDSYLVSHGYGGAQFIQFQNTYRLPINVNGKAGDLTIDTGSPVSVIFRATLKKFGLGQEATEQSVHGAFGKGTE